MMHRFFGRRVAVGWKILGGVGIAALVVAVVCLFALIAQFLWNAFVPAVIGWKPLEYGQALALVVISRILLGFRGGPGGPPWARGRMPMWGGPGWGREEWRAYNEYWKEEGHEAFRQYLEKRRQSGGSSTFV